jgi:hypothetical protein
MSKELAEAFNNIQPAPEVHIEYRLYHDDNGNPLVMSSHNHPEGGTYVAITKQQYDRSNYNCLVVNGKLVFDMPNPIRVQLKKSDTGVAVVQGHAGLVTEEPYPEIEYYDRNS